MPTKNGKTKPAGHRPVARRNAAHILVAEDNTINQKVMLLQLKELGYSADAVASGAEAIEALSRIPYDIVLMDCQMPDMDGYEATTEIRRKENGRHVPIVAMTANAMKGDREKCLAAGMDDYLSKPVKMDALETALDRWANNKAPPAENVFHLPAGLQDAALLKEVTGLYLKKAPNWIRDLKKAVSKRDAALLHTVAHTFKGASGSVGLEGIASLCRELDELHNGDQFSAGAPLIKRIEKQFEEIKKTLPQSARRAS
jgi:CheY-like chemotaxis protein/HPt (histidine-containing phosphotransfer) domain-containing protein